MTLRRPQSIGLAVFATSLFVLAALAACTAPTPDGSGAGPVAAPAGAPGKTGVAESETARVATSTTTPGACEDFGALSGSSLSATSSGTVTDVVMTVAGRPVPTRLMVAAYKGAAAGETVALGAGQNANLATCTHCLVLAVGCTETSCAGASWFFPRAGKALFTQVGYGAGDTLDATFSDVELEHVTIDVKAMTSTPLGSGACVRVPTLALRATVDGVRTGVNEPSGEADAGAGDSDAGGDGGGSSSTKPGEGEGQNGQRDQLPFLGGGSL